MKLVNLLEVGGFYEGRKLSDVERIGGMLLLNDGKTRDFWNTNFNCAALQLNSLEGAPKRIHGNFIATNNYLSSLDGLPEFVNGDVYLGNNYFRSLHNIHLHLKEVKGYIVINENAIRSNVLGLLKIKSLSKVYFDNQKLADIINKYLPGGDILDCQDELIDAGLEEYAKL